MLAVLPLETSKDLKRNWTYLLIGESTFVFSNTGLHHIFKYIAWGFFVVFFCMVSKLRPYFSKAMDNYSDEGKDKWCCAVWLGLFCFFLLGNYVLCYWVWLQWIEQLMKGSSIL